VLLDEVEEDVDPFGRREVRVVLLVSTVGVSEAREHLDDTRSRKRGIADSPRAISQVHREEETNRELSPGFPTSLEKRGRQPSGLFA
jgi:hypothetical protein